MLSVPSSRSVLVRGCRCTRRVPGALFPSTGALMWMKSSSRQKRTVDRPEQFIPPRFRWLNSSRKNTSSFKKDRNLGRCGGGCRRSAGQELLQFTSNTHPPAAGSLPQGVKSRLRQTDGSQFGFVGRMVFYLESQHASTPAMFLLTSLNAPRHNPYAITSSLVLVNAQWL